MPVTHLLVMVPWVLEEPVGFERLGQLFTTPEAQQEEVGAA